MALKINNLCVNCWACVDVCPARSIFRKPAHRHFVINPKTCTECAGAFERSAVRLDLPDREREVVRRGIALNPPGSLSGPRPELVG